MGMIMMKEPEPGQTQPSLLLRIRDGRLDESVRSGRRAREIYEHVLGAQPRLDSGRLGLISALSNTSEALREQGQFAAAVEPIEKAVEIARERARELPEDSDRQARLAATLSELAGVCRKLGRSTDAECHEREAAALRPKPGE